MLHYCHSPHNDDIISRQFKNNEVMFHIERSHGSIDNSHFVIASIHYAKGKLPT